MASPLTQADVARLLAEPSASARAEVADKLAREIDSTALTQAELRIAHDIVRIMAQDAELAVRRALSQSLRSARHLPHDVALRLANDVEAVALPILVDAPVLTDADLIALVSHGSAHKQEAIAGRTDVSEPVADVLVARGSEAAVAALMGNAGAVLGLAFSPDGRYIAYGGSDGTARVWIVGPGVEQMNLRAHIAPVESVRFSPDGRRLATCCPESGTVKVWDLTRHPEYSTLGRTGGFLGEVDVWDLLRGTGGPRADRTGPGAVSAVCYADRWSDLGNAERRAGRAAGVVRAAGEARQDCVSANCCRSAAQRGA